MRCLRVSVAFGASELLASLTRSANGWNERPTGASRARVNFFRRLWRLAELLLTAQSVPPVTLQPLQPSYLC